jgi:LacI family transcriptional regulator
LNDKGPNRRGAARTPSPQSLRQRQAGAANLRDVAERAGVSTASVSRFVNDPATVSQALRVRIQRAVSELAYVPHWAARSLASNRSHTIGAVVPTLEIAIFSAGIEALQERLHDFGYTLLFASCQYDLSRELELVRSIVRQRVDGIVLVGNRHDASVYEMMVNARIPFVSTYAFEPHSAHPCIGFDNHEAAFRMMRHLLDIGHRRFGIISSPGHDNDRVSARLGGFMDALSAAGVDLAKELTIETEYSIEEGRRAFRELLRRDSGITALPCTTDAHALGAVFEARHMGIEIPRELSVTGFDDLDLARQISPSLTTVHVPADDLGRRAAEYILAAVEGKMRPPAVELPVDLVLRESHAPPPAAVRKSRDRMITR